jgi:GH24 family phage-related lysozyme (muramidase)
MKTSDAGLKLIMQFEGLRLKAYRCPAGVWTIGYGHTSAAGVPDVRDGMRISAQEAEAILKKDLAGFEAAVAGLVKKELTQAQFDVLVSFAYNCGVGALKGSTLLKRVNAGAFDAVSAELMKWTKAKGKELPGLVRRRRAEAALWRGLPKVVEPICKVLPIAPSTYYNTVAKRTDVDRLSVRARRDVGLKIEIRRVFEANFMVYGVRKVWRQLQREGFDVARCTVARLMRAMGLQGIIRGKAVRTTVSDKAAPCPLDRVNRQFHAPAPNRLWVSDFTYVSTWSRMVYVAFVIDVYARFIVGWRVSRTAQAGFVLDA